MRPQVRGRWFLSGTPSPEVSAPGDQLLRRRAVTWPIDSRSERNLRTSLDTIGDAATRAVMARSALWSESRYLDFADASSGLGVYVRFGSYPNLGQNWLWVVVVAPGFPPWILNVTDATQLEAADKMIWRTGAGVYAQLNEAADGSSFGLRVGELRDSSHSPRHPLRLDLVWTPVMEVFRYASTTRLEQSCDVTGEVVMNGETFAVSATGQRDHSVGVRDWWRVPWLWAAGAVGSQVRFQVTKLSRKHAWGEGYMARGGSMAPLNQIAAPERSDRRESLTLSLDGIDVSCHPIAWTLLPLASPEGKETVLHRALCKFSGVGAVGSGWLEWNVPAPRKRSSEVRVQH